MVCECQMIDARRRRAAPVPGGLFDIAESFTQAAAPIASGLGNLLNGVVAATACNPAIENFRKPVADVWENNQAAIQTAVGITTLPPFVALGAIVEPLAWVADTVASCKVTDATKRAACRMVQKVTFIGPVLQAPSVHQALTASVGATGASVFAAFGHAAKVAELIAKPFCEGKLPTGVDIAELCLALAAIADKVNKAGGPDVLQAASGVLEPLLGDGLKCIQDGGDPRECAEQVVSSPVAAADVFVPTLTTVTAIGPSPFQTLAPPPPPPPSSGGSAAPAALGLLALLSILR